MIDLVTADWQLDDAPLNAHRHDLIRALPQLVLEHRVERVIVLGDLTEQKDRHSSPLVNRIVRYFHALAKICEVILLRGNHDYLDEAAPFFQFLRRFNRIRFVTKPTVIGDDLFLPHTTDYQRDWDMIELQPRLRPPYARIFCHNTFTGAEAANGAKLKGIPVSIFKPSACVIAGDVHKPQQVGPVTYVGAPYLVDFGDDYEPRMLISRPHHGGQHIAELPMNGPAKRLVELGWPPFEGGWEKPPKLKRGDIVKIRVAVEAKHMPKWSEVRQAAGRWADTLGLTVHLVQPVVSYQPGRRVNPTKQLDDRDLLKAYGRARDVPAPTLEVGQKLMKDTP